MSSARRFAQVDVFSPRPYLGNPVAVLVDAEGLSDEEMRRVARWTNLSETTFLLAPRHAEADYRVRIFTPNGELPFAGHPTLGSARAWFDGGGSPRRPGLMVQECEAGLVEVRTDGDMLFFAAPELRRSAPLGEERLDVILTALDLPRERVVDHRLLDNGPEWAVLRLPAAEDVLALEPDLNWIPDALVGAVGPYPDGSPHAFEIRAFAPGIDVPEDPVTGALNASVAQWFASIGAAPSRYTVSQGRRLGRAGEVAIEVTEDSTVWVGGQANICFTGTAYA